MAEDTPVRWLCLERGTSAPPIAAGGVSRSISPYVVSNLGNRLELKMTPQDSPLPVGGGRVPPPAWGKPPLSEVPTASTASNTSAASTADPCLPHMAGTSPLIWQVPRRAQGGRHAFFAPTLPHLQNHYPLSRFIPSLDEL